MIMMFDLIDVIIVWYFRQSDYPMIEKPQKPRTRTANRFTRPARNDERTEHNFEIENSVSHERTECNAKVADLMVIDHMCKKDFYTFF